MFMRDFFNPKMFLSQETKRWWSDNLISIMLCLVILSEQLAKIWSLVVKLLHVICVGAFIIDVK